jgi:hypothetical protein
MKKVETLVFNWHQAGNTESGIDEVFNLHTVGKHGVVSITENEPHNGNQLWNYVVTMEDGSSSREFNPNRVEYFPNEPLTSGK